VPLDEGMILASVAKTHRLVIAHEAVKRGGFGAEIAALVAEKAMDELDAPIARVGARSVPMPYNDALERATIPSVDDIVTAVRHALDQPASLDDGTVAETGVNSSSHDQRSLDSTLSLTAEHVVFSGRFGGAEVGGIRYPADTTI